MDVEGEYSKDLLTVLLWHIYFTHPVAVVKLGHVHNRTCVLAERTQQVLTNEPNHL